MIAPTKTLPCEFCKQPIPVKRADQEWAAHWACALAGQKRVNEALAELGKGKK
jgi:hypothetical protein